MIPNPEEVVKALFLPDGSPRGLSSSMAGRSGSGKTHLMTHLTKIALKMPTFENVRFIYIGVKREDYFDIDPVSSMGDLFKQISKERLAVYYPPDPEYYEADVDYIINEVFEMVEINEDVRFVLLIDDVNILDGFTSRGHVSRSVKKLVVAGRSKGIVGCFLCHRLGNLPRIMNGNLSSLIVMSINPMDNDYATKMFGIDFDVEISDLSNFRWLYVDLVDEKVHRYAAVAPP